METWVISAVLLVVGWWLASEAGRREGFSLRSRRKGLSVVLYVCASGIAALAIMYTSRSFFQISNIWTIVLGLILVASLYPLALRVGNYYALKEAVRSESGDRD